MIAKYNQKEGVYLGVWPVSARTSSRSPHGCATRWTASGRRFRRTSRCVSCGTARCSCGTRSHEITKTLAETILIVGVACLPVHGIDPHGAGAADRDAGVAGRRGDLHVAFGFSLNLLTCSRSFSRSGLVVDDAIVVVENVERHVREGKSRIDAALIGARELIGPIIAMTITLAVVYTPIAFQGGLTGALFLEFAITLAVAVIVSGQQ